MTGVDDTLEDGDAGYLIITAAADSSDPDYNGLDPADVAITNLDKDTITHQSLSMTLRPSTKTWKQSSRCWRTIRIQRVLG